MSNCSNFFALFMVNRQDTEACVCCLTSLFMNNEHGKNVSVTTPKSVKVHVRSSAWKTTFLSQVLSQFAQVSVSGTFLFFEIRTIRVNARLQSLLPAVVNGMMVLPLCDLTQFKVDTSAQLLHRKHFPSHVALHPGKQEKVWWCQI